MAVMAIAAGIGRYLNLRPTRRALCELTVARTWGEVQAEPIKMRAAELTPRSTEFEEARRPTSVDRAHNAVGNRDTAVRLPRSRIARSSTPQPNGHLDNTLVLHYI